MHLEEFSQLAEADVTIFALAFVDFILTAYFSQRFQEKVPGSFLFFHNVVLHIYIFGGYFLLFCLLYALCRRDATL